VRRLALILTLCLLAVIAAGCGEQAPASGVWGIAVSTEPGALSPSSEPLPGGFTQPSPDPGRRVHVVPAPDARIIVRRVDRDDGSRGEVVARTWATAEGLFLVRLWPGGYVVGAKDDPLSWVPLTVSPDRYTNVMVRLGMRFGDVGLPGPVAAGE